MQVYNAILWLGLVQGLVLGTGLLLRHWGNKSLNPYPLFILGLLSVALLAKLFYTPDHFVAHPSFWYLFDNIPFAIGPLWYLSLRKSREKRVKWKALDYILLTPALYHLGFQVWLLTTDHATWMAYISGPASLVTWMIFPLTVIFVNGGFLVKSHLYLQRQKQTPFPRLMLVGQWIFVGIVGLWLVSYGLSYVVEGGFQLNLLAYEISFLSFALLTQALVFLGMIKPQSFVFLSQFIDQEEEDRLRALVVRIQNRLEKEKAFLANGYNLQQLAEDIASNPVLTSKAINRILQVNFSELVNGYRVQYFVELAQQVESQSYTHWALAQQAGFGNKVTFYKSFKQVMGDTPKSYLNGLKLSKSL